jgi:hypothetical protein
MTPCARVALLAVLTASIAAGCGDSSSSGSASAPPPGVAVMFATLDGAQETPATSSAAVGAGILAVDLGTGKVSGFIMTTGLTATAAHVHTGARGTPGAILVPLTGGPDVWVVPDGATPLTAAQIVDFTAGNLYFNAHTTANPAGEIRGQLDRTGTVRLASLSGAQETPATASTAVGAGILAVDPTSGTVAGFITTTGLTATAAHVHDAARGTPGSVIVPLAGGPNLWVVPDGAAALTSAQLADFAAGSLYYNAHTAENPGGEIRGQLDKGGTLRLASMSGAQETPAVTTTAFGAGVLAVNTTSGAVAGFIATAGLTATAAHVHDAARGTPGSIIVPLAGGPNLWVAPDGAAPITTVQVSDFAAGALYFNAHTPAHPAGEIRGQIDKP